MQEQSQQDAGLGGMSPGTHQTVLIAGGKAAAEATVSPPKHNANQSNDSVQNAISSNTSGSNNKNNTNPVPSNPSSSAATPKLISRLEDLKVSDLKVQLKKRSLPVSGSKPQLLERLKPFTSEVLAALRAAASDLNDSRSSKSSDSPSPSSNGSIDNQAKGMDTGGECAPETIASGEVAMDVGDVLQGNHSNVSPHYATASSLASDSLSLSAAPRFINNSFIINKDMIKLHPEQLETQGKGQPFPVQGQQQFQLQLQYPIFQSQGPSIAIPLASIAAPQFQVITTMAQNQSSPHLTTTASRPLDPHHSHRRSRPLRAALWTSRDPRLRP